MKFGISLAVIALLMKSSDALSMKQLADRHNKLGCCPQHTCGMGCDCGCSSGGHQNGADSEKAIARVESMIDGLKKT